MPLRIRCPNGHKLIVPDDRAGRSLRCPRCGQVTQVPADEVGQASSLPLKDELGARSPVPQLIEAAASNSSGSSSSVLDWPNSIAAPTTVAALEEPIPPPAESMLEPPPLTLERPAPRPNPPAQKPVVKPKSRALPLSPPPPVPPLELRAVPEPDSPIAESPAPPAVAREAQPAVVEPIVVEAMPISQPSGDTVSAEENSWDRSAQETPPTDDMEAEVAAPPVAVASPPPLPIAAAVPLGADRGNTWAAYQLAAALVVSALFSVAPAVWDVVEYAQFPEAQFVARWALVLFLLGVVQLAYAAYLVQLPDWTSVWVVTIYSLVLAAIYAAVLGLVLLSDEAGIVVAALQLSDKLAGGKAVLWCLSMVSVSTILAFFAGRLSARWHRMEGTLRGAGL